MFNLTQHRFMTLGWLLLCGSLLDASPHAGQIVLLRSPASHAETEAGAQESSRAPTPRETLFNLRDRLQHIQRKLPAPDARKLAVSALSDVNFMIRGSTPGSEVPAEYSTSLQMPLRLLDLALKSSEEGHAFSALQAAADDLHIKAEHCRRSGDGLGGMVTVVIRTRNGDREQRNLQVLYMPKLMEAVKNAQPEQFPKLSSPTSHDLPPGRYLMWTREPQSNMMGARTIVRIGDGNKTAAWDLPAP